MHSVTSVATRGAPIASFSSSTGENINVFLYDFDFGKLFGSPLDHLLYHNSNSALSCSFAISGLLQGNNEKNESTNCAGGGRRLLGGGRDATAAAPTERCLVSSQAS
ncbi:hypothetical protein J6590_069023 [Homalodisca vitripennis]|nr:hypothetical protein J6590_069023 [Homalodisca vitripennis]